MGVLWLLYIPTISSLTEAKNATIETTFFVEVSESLSLMPWLALLLLVLASGYHHEKKSFCHCPNLISEVHSKNIVRTDLTAHNKMLTALTFQGLSAQK